MAGALVAVYSAVSTTTVVQAASQNSNRMPIERCIIDGFRERGERPSQRFQFRRALKLSIA